MKIEVLYLGGRENTVIGHLVEAVDGRVFFEYDAEWVARGIQLSPIYLPNETLGSVATPTPGFGPLFGLFADSLPDWWGDQMMKRYFGDKGIPWNSVTALQKLACAGGHAMGAIGYEAPLSGGSFREELTVEVAELVQNAHSFLHGSTENMLPGLIRSGLSPGGAQPKVLLGFNQDFSRAMAGGGSLPRGFERWLLKFDLDTEYEHGKEEYAYSLMARAAGIRMAETHLLVGSDGTHHFLSKRFDRPGDTRRHVHTYSGLTHTLVREGVEYGELMDLTRVLTGSEVEVEEVFRRACFNVFAGNDDDHGKNHAFLMELDGQWKVSPAYDLTSTSNPLVTGMRAASVNGKSVDVGRLDLKRLGESQSVRKIDDTIEEVLNAIKDWGRWAGEAGLCKFRTEQVRDEMPGTGA
ncbi:MAG: type II toxin-antitoxin system HipA family toxin [Verrucomicrobiae bacterium]|nr:type II toxin-antitoxin system HipA family toxin [Verrucomicrobiae bacterium]NNJ42993.1 type II toxin-antitoxin system HipA family toxin [Akkermansiaceae bacterium]